jgi:hypothetical protein
MKLLPGSLMRSLDAAVRSGLPTIFVVMGRGTVSVYPRQHCYVSDVQDWDSVYTAASEDIRVAPSTWGTPPQNAQPLEELQWRLAYHDAAQAGTVDSSHALLHLQHWPNLTQLPEELIEPVTRICALLWRKPTVGYLVARVLDLPSDRVAYVVRVLQMFGHVNQPLTASNGPIAEAANDAAAPQPAKASTASRFFKRLLRLQSA